MTARTVTVTISDDAPSSDGTWPGVDTWGRRLRVAVAHGRPRRGQALRGVLVGDLVTDARL